MHINFTVTNRTNVALFGRSNVQAHDCRYEMKPFSTHLVWSTENINKVDNYLRTAITASEEAATKKRKREAVQPPNLTVIQVEQAAAQPAVFPVPPVTIEATQPFFFKTTIDLFNNQNPYSNVYIATAIYGPF